MYTTATFSNPIISLLSNTSTSSSPKTSKDLNDSIEYYMDSKQHQVEADIVKYLHNLGVKTKTDPQNKEQQYWTSKRKEGQQKLQSLINEPDVLILNTRINRLLSKKATISCPRSLNSINQSMPLFLLDEL